MAKATRARLRMLEKMTFFCTQVDMTRIFFLHLNPGSLPSQKGKQNPDNVVWWCFYGMWVFFSSGHFAKLQHHLTQLGLGQVHLVVLLLQKILQVLNLGS